MFSPKYRARSPQDRAVLMPCITHHHPILRVIFSSHFIYRYPVPINPIAQRQPHSLLHVSASALVACPANHVVLTQDVIMAC